MRHGTRVLLALFAVSLAVQARAQTPVGHTKLALLIPTLYGPRGLVVDSEARLPDGSTHSAHFNSAFQAEFTQFNIALVSQLASVSLPSPASGYTYTFDPTLGVFKRSTQSFGPILSDRAETIGKNKFTFGFNYQRFSFDTIEGVSLGAVPSVFTHDDFQLGGGRADVVTTTSSIDATVGQFNLFFTYGITSRLDMAVAIPVVDADLRVVSHATVQRIGTASSPATHFFADPSVGFGTTRDFTASGAASGIGDVTVRLKGTAPKSGGTTLAMTVDLRLPTGDEDDLLGAGAVGVKPVVILSWAANRFAPHVNLGYQWNGKSLLGGDIVKRVKGELPDQFLYGAGIDFGVTKNLTVAADVLGQRVVDSPRLRTTQFRAANGQTFPQILFQRGSFNVTNGSFGLKINAGGSLLLDFNVLFKLDDAGLRDKVTPLVGFEYSF
jgi:hypothetical protein